MKTLLLAPAELFAISVFADVAVWGRRPELQRLLRTGTAGGKIDAAVIAAALPGLSVSAQRNVLRAIEHMQLIDGKGAMTEFGRECCESGEAPAPELGVFTFLVAKHVCFGALPIAFRREKADGKDNDFANLVAVPPWFAPSPDRIWTSGVDDTQRFTISRFPAPSGSGAACRVNPLPPALLRWEMDLSTGDNRLRVEGETGPRESAIVFQTRDLCVPREEVLTYFATWEPRWDRAIGKVLLAYDGAADRDGRDDFVRTITYPMIKAGARGTFETVKVEGVPVGPIGAREATAWATALILAYVRAAGAYVTPKSWAAAWSAAINNTPLNPGAGAAPDISSLLNQQPGLSPRLRWLLAAGTDLTME